MSKKGLKTPLRYPGGKSRACTKMGEYFPYLRELIDKGKLTVDFEITEESPFKRLSVEERMLLKKTAQS